MILPNIKQYVEAQKEDLKSWVEAYADLHEGNKPALAIVRVGDNPASERYVRNKLKDCEQVGIRWILVEHPEYCTTADIALKLLSLTRQRAISNLCGIIIQLPLPDHIDAQELINLIPEDLDVDGLRSKSPYTPCTPLGIITYLDEAEFSYSGANAVVIGRSALVGKPLANLLIDRGCTVTICNSKTKDLKAYLKYADLVVCAVGKRGVMSSQDAPSAIIVDVGINFDENGKLLGDVIVEESDVDRVTPVPGGVGLLTRYALLKNTLTFPK